jgi:hypothetical protein
MLYFMFLLKFKIILKNIDLNCNFKSRQFEKKNNKLTFYHFSVTKPASSQIKTHEITRCSVVNSTYSLSNLLIVYRRVLRNYHHLLCFKLDSVFAVFFLLVFFLLFSIHLRKHLKKGKKRINRFTYLLLQTSNKTSESSFFLLKFTSPFDFYDVMLMMCFIVSLSRFLFVFWCVRRELNTSLICLNGIFINSKKSEAGMIYFFIKSNEILILCRILFAAFERDYSIFLKFRLCFYANKIPMNVNMVYLQMCL